MVVDEKTMNLIIGRLSNTNSAADGLVLQKWLDESPDHQAEFENYARLWKQADGLSTFPKIDIESQWKIFQSRHFSKQTKVIRLNSWLYAAAAILIIGLFIGTYFGGNTVYKTNTYERLAVELSDGSSIVLKQNTQLKVPRIFNWFNRKLELEGTAFFDVAKNPEKPFEIISPLTNTKVLGTQFKNIATENLNQLEVTEGKVAYWSAQASDTLILTAGEKGELINSTLKESSIDQLNTDSWKSGMFKFNDQPLIEVLLTLQDYYNFDFDTNGILQNKTCSFSGSFESQTLEEILEELKLVMGLQYEFEDRVLLIQKAACP